MVERIRALLNIRQLTPTQFADVIGVARPIISHILSGRNKPSLEVVQRILAAMPDLSMSWLLNGTSPMQAGDTASVASIAVAPPAQPMLPLAPAVAETEERASYTTDNLLTNKLTQAAQVLPVAPPLPRPRRSVSEPVPMPVPATAPRAFRTQVPTGAATPSAKASLRRFAPLPPQSGPVPTGGPVAFPSRSEFKTAPASRPLPSGEVGASPVAPLQAASDAPLPPLEPSSVAAALFTGAEKPIRRIVLFYQDGSFADYRPE